MGAGAVVGTGVGAAVGVGLGAGVGVTVAAALELPSSNEGVVVLSPATEPVEPESGVVELLPPLPVS